MSTRARNHALIFAALLFSCGPSRLPLPRGVLQYEVTEADGAPVVICDRGATFGGHFDVTHLEANGRPLTVDGDQLVGGVVEICGYVFDWWGVRWADTDALTLHVETEDLLPLEIEADIISDSLLGTISGRGLSQRRFRAWRAGNGSGHGKVPPNIPGEQP